jgi:hypothetical protein
MNLCAASPLIQHACLDLSANRLLRREVVRFLTASFCFIWQRSAGWETRATAGREAGATFQIGTSSGCQKPRVCFISSYPVSVAFPQGLKPRCFLAVSAARAEALTYQSCPDTKDRFSGAKARVDAAGFMRGLKPPPPSGISVPQPVKSRCYLAVFGTLRQAQNRLKVIP